MRSFLPQDISRRDTRFFEFQEGFGCALPLGFRARIHSCIYIILHIFSHLAPPPFAPSGGPCMWLARLRRAKCPASVAALVADAAPWIIALQSTRRFTHNARICRPELWTFAGSIPSFASQSSNHSKQNCCQRFYWRCVGSLFIHPEYFRVP